MGLGYNDFYTQCLFKSVSIPKNIPVAQIRLVTTLTGNNAELFMY